VGGTRLKRHHRATWFVLLLVTAAHANPPPVPASVRRMLGAATVLVLPSRCAGAVVEEPWLVATAKHCIGNGARLRVRVAGIERDAELVDEDATADQVVLALASAVPVTPLGVVRHTPTVGMVLYFHGNPERPRWQAARLERIAPCPSLPDLSSALHTTINGAPGDSGAPLVDLSGEVVGLVHGGAKCRIATPGDRLARLIDRVLEREQTRVPRGPHERGTQRIEALSRLTRAALVRST
jgi:S1-C subfamily serine protease